MLKIVTKETFVPRLKVNTKSLLIQSLSSHYKTYDHGEISFHFVFIFFTFLGRTSKLVIHELFIVFVFGSKALICNPLHYIDIHQTYLHI